MNNSSLTGPELVSLAEETYGTIASNQAKLDQSKTGTVNPANEGYLHIYISIYLFTFFIFFKKN